MIKFLSSLFLRKNSVKGASLILMASMVVSNVLGLFRNRFLAQKLPQGDLDTYLAAFRIPDFVFNLLILGAISSAFIPVFTNYIRRKQDKTAWHIANSVINIATLSLFTFCLILAIFMPQIMPKIVPGFDGAQKIQTIYLSRILLLTPLFFGISYILGGVLNCYKRFIIYSLTPLVYNISIILATLFLVDRYSVYGVVIGVIIGSFFHMIIQLPTVIKLGYRWQAVLDFKHRAIRKIAKLMIPRVVGLGANQLVLIFATILSSLWAGHVTYFNFANDIQTFFSVVFGASFSIAVFPFLADYASDKNNKEFINAFALSAKQILYFIIPGSILLILLRVEIVRLILGTGHYGWEATISTANNLGVFAIGVWAASLIQLFARAFYAYEDTKTPAIISVIATIFTIILSYILSKTDLGVIHIFGYSIVTPLQSIGIALAVSLGSILNLILLALSLKNKLGRLDGLGFTLAILKYLICGIIIGVIAQLLKIFIGNHVDMQTFLGVFTKTFGTLIISFGVYLLLTYLLKCDEFSSFFEVFKKRVAPPADVSLDQPVDTKKSQQE